MIPDQEPAPAQFGPWLKGLVNVVSDESVPTDGLVRADNVDIDRDGELITRPTWATLDATKYSSLFKHAGRYYAVRGVEVGEVTRDAFTAYRTVVGPVSWTVIDGDPVLVDYLGAYAIKDNAAVPLVNGYYEDEEEDEYQLIPIPGGSGCGYWQGRLLVSRGTSLLWSEAMRYGVYSATRNYIRFGQKVQWFVPLSYGIYVGLTTSVVFLSGPDPHKFTLTRVGGVTSPGAAAKVDMRHTGDGGEEVAVWFTDVGFAIGGPKGEVKYPQADRLKNLPMPPGRIAVDGDRLYLCTTREF